jgi:hypothetical protein
MGAVENTCDFWTLNFNEIVLPSPFLFVFGYVILLLSITSDNSIKVCGYCTIRVCKPADRWDKVWLAVLFFYLSSLPLYWQLVIPPTLPPGCDYIHGSAVNVAFKLKCQACCSCLFHQGKGATETCAYHRCGPFNFDPSYSDYTWPFKLVPKPDLMEEPAGTWEKQQSHTYPLIFSLACIPGLQPFCWHDERSYVWGRYPKLRLHVLIV